MTNSAPKISDKVARHASPNNNCGKRQNNKTPSVKSTTYFSNAGRNNSSNNNNISNNSTNSSSNAARNGRTSCSPPCNARNTRNSPSKSIDQSPRSSPTSSFYAGAKFSEPPSPATLPKPPSHWTTRFMTSCKQSETCCNISNHLKMILNVQA